MATFEYSESFRATSTQWAAAPLRREEVQAPTSVSDGASLTPALPSSSVIGDAPFYHLEVSLATTDDPATARGTVTVTLEDSGGNPVGAYTVQASGSGEVLRVDPSQVAAVSLDVAIAGGGSMTLAATASIPSLDSY